jgi:hypothetical protein
MRQSGRVIALSHPTCFNSQNTCVGSVPRMQVWPPEEQGNIVHPSILKRGTRHTWARECHVGDEEQSQTDFVSRICSSHPA